MPVALRQWSERGSRVGFIMRASIMSLMTVGLTAYSSSSASEDLEPASTVLPNFMSPSETAKTISEDRLTRIPVRERPRSDYDPIGYRVGPIFFYPQLLSGIRFDSNVFASSTSRHSDLAAVLAPRLTIKSYSPRFSFKGEFGARFYRFRRFHSEDRTDAYANFRARTEVTRDLRFDASFRAARLHEERSESTSPTSAATPVPYTDLRAQVAATKDFNRLSVTVGATARNLSYGNVRSFSGGLLDQSSRNGTILTAFAKPSYELSPEYRVYVLTRFNTRNYEGTGALEHDSKGYDLRGGLQFAPTPLILGSVEAGYLHQMFNNPLIPTVTGPVVAGKVKWLVTPLTTISFFADRSVSETAAPGQEARLDRTFGALVDHELMRNVILFAGAERINQDFRGTPRKDDLWKLSSGVDYFANRFARFGLHYNFIDRRSNIPTFSFDEHVVRVNVTAQY
ncbi:MAG: outer membrane beta-barrel protein [Xanthobacteraceae bacterium]